MDEGCKRAAELSEWSSMLVLVLVEMLGGGRTVFVWIIMVSVSLMTSTVTTMDWGCVNTARSS